MVGILKELNQFFLAVNNRNPLVLASEPRFGFQDQDFKQELDGLCWKYAFTWSVGLHALLAVPRARVSDINYS